MVENVAKAADGEHFLSDAGAMQDSARIVSAERYNDGLVITFADARRGYFSASLLHEVLPRAEEVPDGEEPDDEG